MSTTDEMEKWLEDKDITRRKKNQERLTKLQELALLAKMKPKKEEAEKKTKNGADDDEGEKKKLNKKPPPPVPIKPRIPKYKSASHFMNVHFPSFENDDKVY